MLMPHNCILWLISYMQRWIEHVRIISVWFIYLQPLIFDILQASPVLKKGLIKSFRLVNSLGSLILDWSTFSTDLQELALAFFSILGVVGVIGSNSSLTSARDTGGLLTTDWVTCAHNHNAILTDEQYLFNCRVDMDTLYKEGCSIKLQP